MDRPADVQLAQLAMVRDQLERRGIRDRRVLDAMSRVPRERFVPTVAPVDAYGDRALPLACGQTISQPYIVALMTAALELTGSERVLEVGTGSGYQTAVLAELAAHVDSIENHAELSAAASALLAELGYQNVSCALGDGTRGLPNAAPFDRILVAAAARACPPALLEQLAEGGILIIPIGDPTGQALEQIRKQGGRFTRTALAECRFVPLVGAQ
jgi:protein-L-isoaspartate(D-aspartate) O-methyltransferase